MVKGLSIQSMEGSKTCHLARWGTRNRATREYAEGRSHDDLNSMVKNPEDYETRLEIDSRIPCLHPL
jgi:hypothetical protein